MSNEMNQQPRKRGPMGRMGRGMQPGEKPKDLKKSIKQLAQYIGKYKIAIFCDSEFFHGKDWEVLKPTLERGNNPQFWIKKIGRNIERDDEINKELNFMGWTVIRFWGKDIIKNTETCVQVVKEAIFDSILQEVEDE